MAKNISIDFQTDKYFLSIYPKTDGNKYMLNLFNIKKDEMLISKPYKSLASAITHISKKYDLNQESLTSHFSSFLRPETDYSYIKSVKIALIEKGVITKTQMSLIFLPPLLSVKTDNTYLDYDLIDTSFISKEDKMLKMKNFLHDFTDGTKEKNSAFVTQIKTNTTFKSLFMLNSDEVRGKFKTFITSIFDMSKDASKSFSNNYTLIFDKKKTLIAVLIGESLSTSKFLDKFKII